MALSTDAISKMTVSDSAVSKSSAVPKDNEVSETLYHEASETLNKAPAPEESTLITIASDPTVSNTPKISQIPEPSESIYDTFTSHHSVAPPLLPNVLSPVPSPASVVTIPASSDHPLSLQGEKDHYVVQLRIDRKMAAEILAQTGFEIPLKPGQGWIDNYMIAKGQFGKFYVGYAVNQKRYVGIKILQGTEEVGQEVTLHQELSLQGLQHVLPIIDQHSVMNGEEVILYQVMELAGLGSAHHLKNFLNTVRDLDFKEELLFCLAEGLLQGLAEMHEAGFYHLDVKPNNVVVRQDGRIFLIDFGCSRKSNTAVFDFTDVNGDMSYFSPERHLALIGNTPFCDATKIDAFAAGLTLLFLAERGHTADSIEPLRYQLVREVKALLHGKDTKQQGEALYLYAEQIFAKAPFLKEAPSDIFGSLVAGLLQLDPAKRLSPIEALQHPWFLKSKRNAHVWREKANHYLREFIQAQQREQRSLSPGDLPFGHFTSFIERGVQGTLLQRLLKSSYEDSGYTVCQGMGGVGKTQLATFLVHHSDIEKRFGRMLWFRQADNPSYLETQCILLARELGLIDEKGGITDALPALQAFLLQESQTTQKPWLIVLDNADTPQSLAPYLAFKGGHYLVTTRNTDWNNAVTIDVMTEAEGQALVNTLLQKEIPDALPLCKALGFLPLGIVQACAYIRAENLAVLDYIQRLEQSSLLLERDERSFGKKLPASILGMWEMVFHTLRDKYPEAFTLLEALSLLAPDTIPQKLLDTLGTKASLAILQRYALVQVSQNVGSLHRLLQLAVHHKSHRTLPEILSQAMQALRKIYDFEPATLESIQANRLLLPHGEALYQKYHDIPSPAKTLQTDFYKTLMLLARLAREFADYHKQKTLLEKALTLSETLYGKEHPNVATSLNDLGSAYKALGDAKKAAEYHERALGIKEKVYGQEHPNVATSLNNLGLAYDALGDSKKAIEYYERALGIREKVYGKEHPSVATSLNNLGVAYDALRDAKKAIEYHEQARVIKEKIYGKEHPSVAMSLNNLGSAYHALGDAKKAIEYYERALVILEKVYGQEHPFVATSLNNLGMAYYALGDSKKAAEYHERALGIREKIYGQEHPDVAQSLNNLGVTYDALGDAKKAIEYGERVLVIQEKIYGQEHPHVATSLHNLGMAYRALGDATKAIEYFERALVIQEKIYGKEHRESRETRELLHAAMRSINKNRVREVHENEAASMTMVPFTPLRQMQESQLKAKSKEGDSKEQRIIASPVSGMKS